MCLPTATNDHLSIFIRNDFFVGMCVCVCVSNCNQRNERHNELWRASEMWTAVSGHMWILIISIDEARLPFAVNSITKANSHTPTDRYIQSSSSRIDNFRRGTESNANDLSVAQFVRDFLCCDFLNYFQFNVRSLSPPFAPEWEISNRLNPCESVWDRMRWMEIFVWYA